MLIHHAIRRCFLSWCGFDRCNVSPCAVQYIYIYTLYIRITLCLLNVIIFRCLLRCIGQIIVAYYFPCCACLNGVLLLCLTELVAFAMTYCVSCSMCAYVCTGIVHRCLFMCLRVCVCRTVLSPFFVCFSVCVCCV